MLHNGHTDLPTISAYASALTRHGKVILPGAPGTFWTKYESLAMMRVPDFALHDPPPGEVERVLWRGRIAVASYNAEPDAGRAANACLYVSDDQSYSVEKLIPAMRRNVRRGLKEFTIGLLNSEQVLARGMPAYCDTRRRVGLSDGTAEAFERRFNWYVRCPGHVFVGAWKGDELAAFLSIVKVDDWAEIEGCFSRDMFLSSRPNDLLMYMVLSRYLTEERLRLVSYGMSSIQQTDNVHGLHAFKTKVGFQAKPVHRAFVLHPLLRPFANHFALHGVNAVGRLFPNNRLVKKARGMLALLLGGEPLVESFTGSHGR